MLLQFPPARAAADARTDRARRHRRLRRRRRALCAAAARATASAYFTFCRALFLRRHARHRQPLARRARRVRGDDAQGRRRLAATSCSPRCCCFASSITSCRSCWRWRCSARTRRCGAGARCARRSRRRETRRRLSAARLEHGRGEDRLRRNLSGADCARIRSREKLIDAMPEPAILVDAEARRDARQRARRATSCRRLRIGEPLVLALRAPDVIDAIRRVAAGGEAETALWSERVPDRAAVPGRRRAARRPRPAKSSRCC